MASIEKRFEAAVNVIKGLPKNGPYQPSTAMMLKFYGYYKQATEGPCHQRKPAFWDIIGKAKWDAWNSNQRLTPQQAMQRYVEELREIIETMSYTENVQNFVGSINDGLDKINLDELELIAPGMREIAETHPDSPFNSRTNSPQHGTSTNAYNNTEETLPFNGATKVINGNGSLHLTNGDVTPTPFSSSPQEPLSLSVPLQSSSFALSNGTIDQSDDEYGDPVDIQHELTEALTQNSELLKQIQVTILRMNADVCTINQRMLTLEKSTANALQKSRSIGAKTFPTWWPFRDISPAWFVLLVLWPFIVRRLSKMLPARHRH